MDSSRFNHFYKTNFVTTILRILLASVLVSPTISSLLWVKKNNPFFIVVIGRNIWPAGFGGFAIYTSNKYFSIKFGLANTTDTSVTKPDDVKDGPASSSKVKNH